jgi:hypothetical protein
LEEIEIEPHQINQFKIEFHKIISVTGLQKSSNPIFPGRIMEVREQCIALELDSMNHPQCINQSARHHYCCRKALLLLYEKDFRPHIFIISFFF